jgi:hypothetical protein
MNIQFTIPSEPQLLEKAARVAQEFAQQYMRDEIVGIVFLGAIARGYFDHSADIDIAIFKKQASGIALANKFIQVEGLEVHIWLSDYETDLTSPWDMARRWTFSQRQVFYDPQGLISRMLDEKVPLRPDEKKWLLMSGVTLSEWYINRLTQLWVERGNLISAHHMFDQGLNYFFDMLFGLNNQLVADTKWRYYCVEKLARLPEHFCQRIQDVMTLRSISVEELERRKEAFMGMWEEMKPIIETEVGLSFDEMVQLV